MTTKLGNPLKPNARTRSASLKIGTNTLQFRQLCNTWRTASGEKV